MTTKHILEELKPGGSDSYKRVIFNHGLKERCFGVKIGDLQRIPSPQGLGDLNRRRVSDRRTGPGAGKDRPKAVPWQHRAWPPFADEIAADGGEVLPELLFQMPKNC
jgi:hypothetical protein